MQLQQFEAARADSRARWRWRSEAAGPDVLTCWIGRAHLALARALKAQGKLDEARAAYVSAVKHLESSLGKEHAETIEAVMGANP